MRNTLKRIRMQTVKGKFSFSAFQFSLFALCFLVVLGCNKSVQKPVSWPNAVSVDALIPEATRIVQEGLADKNPYARVNAIEVVASTRRIELMPEVQQMLKGDFASPVRFASVLAVGDLEYRLAEPSIKPLLNDKDENIRIAAAYAMGKFGSRQHFDLIRRAIASRDQTVRANAALLLGKSGDKSALKFLYITLRERDSDDRVRFQATEAIAMLGDERIYPKLWTMLISAYADDRIMGIRAMGALGTPKARDVLVTKLDDDVLEVRLAAAEQLGLLGDTIGEPVVLNVFRKNLPARLNKRQAERVYVMTALAIGRIGTPRLTRFLPQLLRNESEFVRIAAAKAVFQCSMRK